MSISLLANIDVDDLDGAAKFYCSALELTIGRRFGDSAIELLGASSPIYLLKHAAGTPATSSSAQQRDFARHWTPMRTHSWGHIAMFADPFGHGFCLIEFLGRGYDEIAT